MRLVTAIACFLLTCCLLSCGAKKSVTGTDRSVTDSTIVREIPVKVEIPGTVAESPEVNYQKLDSMIKAGVNISLINAMLQGNKDPTGRLSAKIQLDEKGNLRAVCELQEQVIELMSREIERLRIETEQITIEVSKTWYEQLWHDFKQLIVGALMLLAFLTVKKFLT